MTRYAQRTLIQQGSVANWGKAAPTGIGVVQGYGVATGGTSSSITVSSQAYTLLSFTSDDNLVVSTAGLFDVLLIGGGGASRGVGDSNSGGGAGAGGVFQQTVYFEAGTWTVDVGAGGAGISYLTQRNNNGAGSSIYNAINKGIGVAGGGSGGGYSNQLIGTTGGSSGGNGNSATQLPVSNLGLSGNLGGTGTTNGGGGGGGAGAVGANGSSGVGAAGGAGLDISVFLGQVAATTIKAGGGGGPGTTAGAGGSGGGGAGATGGGTGTNGTANSGGGGGGGENSGSGGSGIIYVRFKV